MITCFCFLVGRICQKDTCIDDVALLNTDNQGQARIVIMVMEDTLVINGVWEPYCKENKETSPPSPPTDVYLSHLCYPHHS